MANAQHLQRTGGATYKGLALGIKTVARHLLSMKAYRQVTRMKKRVLGYMYRRNLSRLAVLYGTDKWGGHWYTQHYQRYFEPLRTKRLNLLEIGVGGYENPAEGAESLRMWRAFFRRGQIVGVDIYDKSHLSEHRMDIVQGDQTDVDFLTKLCAQYGGFDIIIDDGSHINEHVIMTFNVLFPLLRTKGIYVVEDTQTAYWPSYGGGVSKSESSMSFFKQLADGLNYQEFPLFAYSPNSLEQHIVGIAFFHNMVFIFKGLNNENGRGVNVAFAQISS